MSSHHPLLGSTFHSPLATFLVKTEADLSFWAVNLGCLSSRGSISPQFRCGHPAPEEGSPQAGSPACSASALDSPSADPALRVPASLHRAAPLHPLRGLLRGHAHPHHLEEGRPRHPLRLWSHHREQGVHELPADLQRLPQAQRQLHLHRQQRRCHGQPGAAAHRAG